MNILDPVEFQVKCWPHVHLYNKQREILYSVMENEETFVPAGNALGKDFVAALCALWFFCTRRPARVVTTSVKYDQLNDVLWGEIRNFIHTSVIQLPIQYNHLHIRQIRNNGTFVDLAELRGQTVSKGEAILGRHLPKGPDGEPTTLVIFDEASGVESEIYEKTDTWAHRKLIIGNPYPCANFFYQGVKGGDIKSKQNGHYYRKIIKIKAVDSPNVRLAEKQEREGKEVTNETIVPGVIDYTTYQNRREFWDEVRQCIGLDAEFYEGADVLMFPPAWLTKAEEYATTLSTRREGEAIGVDPAEGGDSPCWSIVDHKGLIDLISKKTSDTSTISGETIALMTKYKIKPEKVFFDRGGGGKQHADRLRAQGYNVKTVAFGESVLGSYRFHWHRTQKQRIEQEEDRYVYKNRRAQMYGILRELLDPINEQQFGISEKFVELRRQLAPIPLTTDQEGRLYLLPKDAPPRSDGAKSTAQTLKKLLGCSPDEADSLVLAVYGMVAVPTRKSIMAY